MYKNTKIRVLLAIVIAFIGAMFAYQFIKTATQKEPIIVAARDIPSRTQIKVEDLKEVYVNKEDRALFFPYAVATPKELIGTITKDEIKANTPIQKTPNFLVYDEQTALALNYKGAVDNAYFIPKDKRVIGIEVDTTGGVGNKLNRGDFVDLIYTSIDEGKGGYYSTIISEHIPIFDIEAVEKSGGLEKKQKILLLASPEECVKIAVAKRNGVIDLMLNPLNGEIGNNAPVNLKDFAVKENMDKAEMIKGLEEYIGQQNISEENKKVLLANLQKEKDKEALKQSIEASNLSPEKKKQMLQVLAP